MWRTLAAAAAVAWWAGCSCGEAPEKIEVRGPALSQVSPATGPSAGGTVVLLRGERFAPEAKVTFAGQQASTLLVADPGSMTVVAPAGVEGIADITVTNPDGADSTLRGAFTYHAGGGAAPTITAVLPSQGPTPGGSLIEVHGTNFSAGMLAFLGGRPVRALTVVSPELITLVTPGGAVGPTELAVTDAQGYSARLDGGFTYYDPATATQPPPMLVSVIPVQGSVSGYEDAVVTGTGFLGSSRVYLGGFPAGAATLAAGQLKFKTPPGRPGTVDVVVTNPDGQSHSLPGAFNYYTPAAVLSRVDPAFGPVEGGTPLTISGRNFVDGASVTLGGKPLADLTFVDERTLRGKAPATSAWGWADLEIVLPGSITDKLTQAYFYTDAEHPYPGSGSKPVSIARVIPTTASAAGGTAATLLGSGFQKDAAVTVGGSPADDVKVLGATSIAFRLPPGRVGPAAIEVVNPDGGKARLSGQFSYYDAASTAAAPAVGGVTPATGPTTGGTRVAVLGANFDKAARVFFGSEESARVLVLSGTQLVADAPAYGDAGAVDVTVSNPDGKSATLVSGYAYYIARPDQLAPQVSAVTPNKGPAGQETQVTVAGRNFQAGATVYAGLAPASAVTINGTMELTAKLPGQAESKVAVVVVNPDGMFGSLDSAFEYTVPQLELLAVEPKAGPAKGGTGIKLKGRSFQSGAVVEVGGKACEQVEVLDAQVINCLTPAGEDGLAAVKVTNPDGKSSELADAFTYAAAPRVAKVEPASGPAEGGGQVTITGEYFREGLAALVGKLPCGNLVRESATSIKCQVPPGAPGPAAVTLTNPDGQAGSLANGYQYLPPVSLVRAIPATGPETGGITVSLLGDGFQSGLTVKVGGAEAGEIKVLGATSLSFKLPPGAKGPALIEVGHPSQGKTSLAGAFSYYDVKSSAAAPSVTRVLPAAGPVAGGTRVLLQGSSFVSGARVLFGDVPSPLVKVAGAAQIVAVTPSMAAPGTVPVMVVNPDGKADTLVPGFAFYVPAEGQAAPKISAIDPQQVSSRGETPFKVFGESLQAGALVFAGDLPCKDVALAAAGQLSALAPPQAVGFVDVTVVNPDGLSATASSALEYVVPAPKVTAVRPNRGPVGGGVTAVVVGEGFERGANVSFGRTLASDVRWVDTSALKVVVPAGVAGKSDVTVVNPDGQVAVLVNAFDYDADWVAGPRPEVTGVQPHRGPTTGGTALLVKGGGFVKGSTVWFAESPATDVTLVDEKTLYAVTPAVSAGPAHVAVINPDGQSAVLAGGFTFVEPSQLGPKPTLTGLSPSSGRETGVTTVLLTGRNFRSGAYVFFGGMPGSNPLMLSSAIYQSDAPPHAPGPVDVALTNPDGTSAILKGAFAYVPRPTLATLTPEVGPTAGGTKVLVTGEGFQGGAQVKIGGLLATSVVLRSTTLLECVTPSGEAGPADVTVINPDLQEYTLEDGFTFVPPPALAENPVTPSSGPSTGGTRAIVRGEGFQPGVTVSVAGKPAQTAFVDEGTLVADLPASSVGYADLTVKNPDGQTATATRAFLYKDPAALGAGPTLSASAAVLPRQGPKAGGTVVTISGGKFQDGAMVFVGMLPAEDAFYVAADTLTATTPASEGAGKVAVAVTNPDGQTAKAEDAFEYVEEGLGAAPAITALLPQEASIFGDSVIAVAGANLKPGAQFYFGGRPAPSAVVSSGTEATVTAPTGVPGQASVVVTNPDGQTASYKGTFTYVVPPPKPLVVNPNTGSTRGGTAIVISGNSFQAGATVQIAGAACAGTKVVDSRKIECKTPPGVDGPAAVKVTNADGQSGSLSNGFTYVAPPEPQKVSPTSGPEGGGTTISITGTFFGDGATVKIGTKDCQNVQRVSAALIVCDVPAGTAGPAAVTVTNTDGQSGTLAAGFTYLPPVPAPKVTGVVPPYGSIRGGSAVTVVGEGFQAGAAVKFGALAASSVTVMSANSLTCLTPAVSSPAKVDVTVTNPDGQAAKLAEAYEYLADAALPSLAVTSIVPNNGAMVGGTQVTITGNGFQAGLAVTLGTKTCQSLGRLGPTALVCTTPSVTAPGPVDVTVTNPDGQQIKVANGFTYDLGGRYVAAGQNLPLEASTGKRSALMVDVDKDNDPDYFQLSAGPGAWLQINDGQGRFTSTPGNLPSEASNPDPQPLSVAHADVDKDGDQDILYTSDRHLVLYKNDGAGAFTRVHYRPCTYTSGSYTYDRGGLMGMAVGDVDKDGDPDVVLTRWTGAGQCWNGSAYVGAGGGELLLINDGSGAFTRRDNALPQVDDNSRAARLADFDRDGDLDVLVVNDSNHQNRLYYNNGSGVFTDVSLAQLGVSAGNGQDGVAGDIDRDNDLDIVIANNGQRNRLYVNDGAGKFTDVTLTSRMPNDTDATGGVYLVDYDNDGDLDLLTRKTGVSGAPHTMRVYRNDGTGFFGTDAAGSVLPAALGEVLSSVVFGDVDKDGYTDMLWMQEGYQNRLLVNDTAGKFVRRTVRDMPEENAGNEDALGADFDGDGDVDLAVCGTGPMRPKLFLNDGAGNLVDYTEARMPNVPLTCYDAEAADFDADGALDLVFASTSDPGSTPSKANGASVYYFRNNGTGVFSDVTFPRLPTDSTNRATYPMTLETLDYDGDDDLDLVVGNNVCSGNSRDSLRLWQNVGSNSGFFMDVTGPAGLGGLTNTCPYSSPYGTTNDIGVGDFNDDGRPDLFLARVQGDYYSTSTRNVVFSNNGDGSFTNVTSSKLANPTGGRRALVHDFNKDGSLDVYLVNGSDDRLYLNISGLFSDVTPSNLPRQDSTVGVTVVDADKNGTWDLVVAKASRARPRLLLNAGLGIYQDFTNQKMQWSDDSGSNVVRGDFDGDGELDILYLTYGQPRLLLRKP